MSRGFIFIWAIQAKLSGVYYGAENGTIGVGPALTRLALPGRVSDVSANISQVANRWWETHKYPN